MEVDPQKGAIFPGRGNIRGEEPLQKMGFGTFEVQRGVYDCRINIKAEGRW